MTITIIGAGAIGSALAYILSTIESVDEVRVCDPGTRSLRTLKEQVDSHKLRPYQVDIGDPAELRPIFQSSNCVIACEAPERNPALARLCVETFTHFCDLGGPDEVVAQVLALSEEAAAQGVWLLPNCGLAPGLVNILCLLGVEQFDDVEAAFIRVGSLPLDPTPPFNFRVAWSAQRIISDYINPVLCVEDGAVATYEPFSHLETIQFRPPFGALEAFSTAGSISQLATALGDQIQTLNHKTIRWPGHAAQMQFLLGLGFGAPRSIDVRTHLTYHDILVRRLRQVLGGEHRDAVLMRVLLHGHQEGQPRTLVYEMIDQYNEVQNLMAMKRCTSIPAALVAMMLAAGELPGGGAALPEQALPKSKYCQRLTNYGLDIDTTWHDGHLPVTDA